MRRTRPLVAHPDAPRWRALAPVALLLCASAARAAEPAPTFALPENHVAGQDALPVGTIRALMPHGAPPDAWRDHAGLDPHPSRRLQAAGNIPSHCPVFEGDLPYETTTDDGPVLALFSEAVPPGSLQIPFGLNDDWSLPSATPDAYDCDDITEGTEAYRLELRPTPEVPEAFFFVHTLEWKPANLTVTRALAFDVKTDVPFDLYLASKDEHGDAARAELPIDRYAAVDGQWHSVEIPLEHFEGVRADRVIIPFGIDGVTTPGTVRLDHIRFTEYRGNHPPGLAYDGKIRLGPDERTKTVRVLASDVDGDALTWSVFTPPAAGAVSLRPDPFGLLVTYAQTDGGGWDGFELHVDDGNGHFLTLPFKVQRPEAPPRSIALLAPPQEGRYSPPVVLEHWNGGGELVATDEQAADRGQTLQAQYADGAVVIRPAHGVPLDLSRHPQLTLDLWWEPLEGATPSFKLIFESRGASPYSAERRHEIPFTAEPGRWNEVTVDISEPFPNNTDKANITKVLLYVADGARVELRDLVVRVGQPSPVE